MMANMLSQALRSFARAAAVVALVLFAASCAAAKAPAGPQPIIAMGDLHGDYAAYIALMEEAKLVDAKGRWTGGNTIFVQTGDVPDRGPDSLKIIRHLMKIEKQAKKSGGAVVALTGNHEAMNMTGDLRYVIPAEYAAFATSKSKKLREAYFKAHAKELTTYYKSKDATLTEEGVQKAFYADAPLGYIEHRQAWSSKGEVGAWVASHDAVRIVGDTLFVHGGISHLYITMTADAINQRVRDALKKGGDRTVLEDQAGPLWHRGNADAETPAGEAEVAAALASFKVKRLVIGHTPNLTGIKALYGGRVIQIDTGISSAYGGTRSYLKIEGDKLTAYNNGAPTLIPGSAP